MSSSSSSSSFDNSPNLADEDIYLNITLFNPSIDQDIKAEYREERRQPILKKASDYKMSIIRFDLPTDLARIFVFDSSRVYNVTFLDPVTGTVGTESVSPIVSDLSSVPLSNQNNINFFKQIIIGVNNALGVAFTNFIAAYPGGLGAWTGAGGTPVNPTFLVRDNTNGLVSFYHRQDAGDNATQPLHLYLSHSLFQLFNFTFSEFYGYQTVNDLDNRIPFYNFGGGLNAQTISATPYWINQQEANISGSWYDTYKIVILTESMPVRHESITVTDTTSDSDQSRSSLLKRGVLTDFNYEFVDANIERINYAPSSEYRWTDLLSDTPLYKFDFKVYIENDLGELIPVFLGPGDSFNMKILWRKK